MFIKEVSPTLAIVANFEHVDSSRSTFDKISNQLLLSDLSNI